MAAPKGNQFWRLRSKHGRDKLFASPVMMWNAACEYFEWCDNNPWIKKEAIKSGDFCGTLIDVPTTRPYTMQGLCLYLCASITYFRTFKQEIAKKAKPAKKDYDFLSVIERIEETVFTQKFEGAAVGAFNANIIARDLGLADKTDNVNKNTNTNYNTDITPEEMKTFDRELENEV